MLFSPLFCLVMNGIFFSLRLTGGSGSFPPPLSGEDEKKYLEEYANGSLEARNKLVEHNLRLVAHIIKKYYAQADQQDDLISIGTIGLIKGISTFKADKNVRLATYASRCIENEILMHFRSIRKSQGDVSLSDALDGSDEAGALSLMDVISVDDTMLEDLENRDSRRKVRDMVDRCLKPRERDIIKERYGLDSAIPKTQREIADKCGISRSYVSRIEKRALEALKEAFDKEELQEAKSKQQKKRETRKPLRKKQTPKDTDDYKS